jgi:hypothetical protein
VPAGGGAAVPWVTLPLPSATVCKFARDGVHALCEHFTGHGDMWLIENFGELVEAAR